jgi:CRISPR/Cas system-associated endonuclease Cas1
MENKPNRYIYITQLAMERLKQAIKQISQFVKYSNDKRLELAKNMLKRTKYDVFELESNDDNEEEIEDNDETNSNVVADNGKLFCIILL